MGPKVVGTKSSLSTVLVIVEVDSAHPEPALPAEGTTEWIFLSSVRLASRLSSRSSSLAEVSVQSAFGVGLLLAEGQEPQSHPRAQVRCLCVCWGSQGCCSGLGSEAEWMVLRMEARNVAVIPVLGRSGGLLLAAAGHAFTAAEIEDLAGNTG